MTKESSDPAQMSFEDALAELERIVAHLERGDVPLADSIRIYKRGAALRARCEAQLKDAQLGRPQNRARTNRAIWERETPMSNDPCINARLPLISLDDFLKVDIRLGTIVDVRVFEEAKKAAYQLWIDFGEPLGIKKSSAQVTQNYDLGELLGRRVAAVVNFEPKQIGKFMSEVLCLGFPDRNGDVVLLNVDRPATTGGRLY